MDLFSRRLRPTAFLLAIIALIGSTLGACSMTAKPNEPLVNAWKQAEEDSISLKQAAPDIAALRGEHAKQIIDEIQRLCGYDKDKNQPESCAETMLPTIEPLPTDNVAEHIAHSQDSIIDSLGNIPLESVAVLSQQYIDQAPYDLPTPTNNGGREPQTRPLFPADFSLAKKNLQEVAIKLLKSEYGWVWALGLAQAHVGPEQVDYLNKISEGHQYRMSLLEKELSAYITPEEMAVAYTITDLPEPTDQESALEFVRQLQERAINTWKNAALGPVPTPWRRFAVQTAGDIARDTVNVQKPKN